MRFLKADTAANYERTFNVADHEKSMEIMANNKMYEQNHEKYILTSPLTGNKLKHRLLIVRQNEKIRESTKFVFTFNVDIDNDNFIGTSTVIDAVKKAVVYGSYKEHMFQFTNIREYCTAGIFTSRHDMFIYFLNTSSIADENMINKACQQIMTQLLIALQTATQSAKTKIQSCFWVNVMSFLNTDKFDEIIEYLPCRMKNRVIAIVITLSLMNTFEHIMTHAAIKPDCNNKCNTSSSDMNTMTKVTRLVGWAVYSRKCLIINMIKRESKTDVKKKTSMKPQREN